MRITSSGDVGIGDAAPADKLEVNGGSSYPHIRITSSSNTSRYMRIGMANSTDHVIEANGSSTELIFKTAGTEHARINSSGIFTNPSKPFVLARRNGNLTSYNMSNINGNTTAIYNYVESAQSNSTGTSAFSTTTGRFTAPVAGVYLITASAYANVSIEQMWLTDSSGNRHSFADITQGVVSTSTAQVMTGTIPFYLGANVSIGVHFYSSGDTAATIYANNYHTYFRCVLIG